MSYSPSWRMHWIQQRQMPSLLFVAGRYRPILEEWYVPFPAKKPTPLVIKTFCALCWGAGFYWERSVILGWMRVVCDTCKTQSLEKT